MNNIHSISRVFNVKTTTFSRLKNSNLKIFFLTCCVIELKIKLSTADQTLQPAIIGKFEILEKNLVEMWITFPQKPFIHKNTRKIYNYKHK